MDLPENTSNELIEPTNQISPKECLKLLGNHCWSIRRKKPNMYDGKIRTCHHCGTEQEYKEVEPQKKAVCDWS